MERPSRCTFGLFSLSVLNRAEREIQKRLRRTCNSLESTATAKMEKESRRSRANSPAHDREKRHPSCDAGRHFRWSIREHSVIPWTPVRKRLTLLSCFHENAIKTLSPHFLKRS